MSLPGDLAGETRAQLCQSFHACTHSALIIIDRVIIPSLHLAVSALRAACTYYLRLQQVFLATENILLDEHEPRTALGFVSAVGNETVVLDSSLELNGKVEVYLTDLHHAMQATLKVNAL